MAYKLSNINDLFRVKSDGAIEFGTSGAGTSTYVLTSAGPNASPTWTEPTIGTVTGTGTENKVVRWTATAGAIGDGPITFSSNAATANSTFGGSVDVTGNIIARTNASYYATRNYLGETWEFASDTADGVTFKITGGAADTTGNFFKFQTQSGGATADTKLIIDKSGNVGIGEDLPLKPLHIYAPDNGGNIRLTRDGTSEYKDISTYYSLTTGNESILGTTSAHNTFLWTNNYPALRITTDQEVCLLGFAGADGFVLPQDENTGYSNFAAGGFGVLFREAADNYMVGNAYYYRTGGVNGWRAKYPASGATLISSNVGELGFQTAVANTTAPYNISFTPRMIIKNNGNVGIGTIVPGVLLQVGETPTSSSPQGARIYGYDGALSCFTTRAESNFNTALYLYNNPVGEPGTGTGIMLRARSSTTDGQQQATIYSSWTTNTHASRTAKLVFQTANSGAMSDKMIILGNGNVGINTTSPAKKLDVARTATTFSGASTDEGAVIRLTNPSNWENGYDGNGFLGGIEFYSGDTSESGPAVFGAIKQRMLTYYNDTAMCFFTSPYNGSLTERIRITSGGNVGIGTGTTSPGQKLTVSDGSGVTRVAVIETGNAVAGAGTQFVVKNGATTVGQSTTRTDNVGNYSIFTGTTSEAERMRIKSGGDVTISTANCKVGIGTTSLSSISGGCSTMTIGSTAAALSGGIGFQANATGKTFFYWESDNMRYQNVGDFSHTFYKNNSAVLFTIATTGTVTAVGDIVAYSDKKLKKNIKTLDGSKVYKMRGVSFDRIDTGKKSSGVIAQEMQEVAPELIDESKDGTLGVAYGNIIGYLIEAIKELKTEIEELKKCKCDCKK